MLKNLDKVDLAILSELQNNGRLTNHELASKVELSPSPVSRRVRDLEDSNVIQKYVALVNPSSVGCSLSAFIRVKLERDASSDLNTFESAIQNFSEVMECYLMTGDYDYILRVALKDIEAFDKFLRGKLTKVPGIASISTNIAVSCVVFKTELPFDVK